MKKKKKEKKTYFKCFVKKPHNVPNYVKSRGKTSVVIEKKPQEDGVKKNFKPRNK